MDWPIAHSRGVVHRDIKPTNILVTPDGRVKIMDFGIAHIVGSELTPDGVLLGSPNYMAPEQLSKRALDPRTDLFAFGIVLYRMLTGRLPFEGDSFAAIAQAVLTEDPPSPETVRAGLDPAVARVVMRCLSKDPEKRFPNAESLQGALSPGSMVTPTRVSPRQIAVNGSTETQLDAPVRLRSGEQTIPKRRLQPVGRRVFWAGAAVLVALAGIALALLR